MKGQLPDWSPWSQCAPARTADNGVLVCMTVCYVWGNGYTLYRLNQHRVNFRVSAETLTLNTVIPFFHRTLQLIMLCYQTKFGCKPTTSLEDTPEIVIFWLYKLSLWPWPWTQWINFMTIWLMMLHNHTRFVTKCFVVQKISSRQTFTKNFEPWLWPWP